MCITDGEGRLLSSFCTMKINSNDLTLESYKSAPELNAAFLDKGVLFTEFRNNSQNIINLHEVSCQFTSEDGLMPAKFTNSELTYIKPKTTRTIQISVRFGLELKRGTNAYSICVKFKSDKLSRMKKQSFRQHGMNLIIHTKRDCNDEFFESHKDPQDTAIANRLKFYLAKSGFKGFVAEAERRPGINFWEDKVLPSIDQCKALIVIWTENSQNDPKVIKREINYAKKKNKPIILIIEGDLSIPKIISSKKEYFRFKKITDEVLIDVVTAINETYELGGYEKQA